MKIYLLFNSVEKNRKTLFVFTFLRERTERWLKPSLRKKLNDDENDKEIFTQFSKFKKEIRRIFEVFNEKQTAERIVQHLIQKTSASDYAARFQKHVNLIEWNDVAFMIMFRQELKDNVKDEIMRDERDYKSLTEHIEIVIDFNDKLYERVMKKRYDRFRDRARLIYKLIAEYAKSKQQSYIRNSEYTELASMKLKMTHRRRRKNLKSKKKDKKKKLCYECEKTNYFVKNCRNESVMLQQQLNVTLKKTSETDDMKKAVNETVIQKINSDNEYCIVSSKTKLQKVTDATSNKTKQINFRIEKFKRSSTSHSDWLK